MKENTFEFDDMEEFREYGKKVDEAIKWHKKSSILSIIASILLIICIVMQVIVLFRK